MCSEFEEMCPINSKRKELWAESNVGSCTQKNNSKRHWEEHSYKTPSNYWTKGIMMLLGKESD